MNYILSLLIIGALIFVIVKNVIGVVKTIKEKRQAKKENVVEVTESSDIDNK